MKIVSDVRLRNLQQKDLNAMKVWMNDNDTIKVFAHDFRQMTDRDILDFIENSISYSNKHFAIVNRNDEYMGTVSLKNINVKDLNAEYAIVVSPPYRGGLVAYKASQLILEYAFRQLKLQRVYLNVLADNITAIKFYEKFGFKFEGVFRKHILHDNTLKDLKWYAILNEEVLYNE